MNKAIAACFARDDVQGLVKLGVAPTDTTTWTDDYGCTHLVTMLSATGDVTPKPYACIRWLLEGDAYWRCLDLDEVSLLECAVWERDEQMLGIICENASDAPTEEDLYRALRDAAETWSDGADYLTSRLKELFPDPDLGSVVSFAYPGNGAFSDFIEQRLRLALSNSTPEQVKAVCERSARLSSFCTQILEERVPGPWARVGGRLVRD
jgi:hypothetical protein